MPIVYLLVNYKFEFQSKDDVRKFVCKQMKKVNEIQLEKLCKSNSTFFLFACTFFDVLFCFCNYLFIFLLHVNVVVQ